MLRLYYRIRTLKPYVVNAGTPKAGLLGMIASCMAEVPVRIYTARGLRLATKSGFTRFVLKMAERIASFCATEVICVSESLKQVLMAERLAPERKTKVLGAGSSNGVDVRRFRRTESSGKEAQELRSRLGIPLEARIIGFVGRMTRDKGVMELLYAFDEVSFSYPGTYLLVLGDWETGDPVDEVYFRKIEDHRRIVKAGFVSDTAPYYHVMDVLVFPSHREGFPNAPLEAAAAGIPTVGFRVPGTMDAVQDGTTGILVGRGDASGLAKAICKYFGDDELRKMHGQLAFERASQDFNQELVWELWHNEYCQLLSGAAKDVQKVR